MKTVAQLTTPTTLEFEKEIAELHEKIATNDNDLVRVAGVSSLNKTTALRNLLDTIYALDIDSGIKREMTDTCLHLIDNEVASKRFDTELTENDAAFIGKLEKKHPNLNARELKICLFIKLNYDNVEIAHFTGITPRGLESLRYRTHRKLGLARHDSMKSYLMALSLA